jgi:hypothetical protein
VLMFESQGPMRSPIACSTTDLTWKSARPRRPMKGRCVDPGTTPAGSVRQIRPRIRKGSPSARPHAA